MKKYSWTYAGMDEYIHDVMLYVAKTKGWHEASIITEPLSWWARTGRASVTDCKLIVEKRPYVIARILMEMPFMNYADIIDAVKKKITA